MAEFENSIAHEAHGLVHGERAKTYGHPRFDFSAIAKVWTGLLQDLLKDGEALDAHRISVLMSGLKLCRLVKSPQHRDSRVDVIGYMLTMERLDEPESVGGLYNPKDVQLMEGFAAEEGLDDDDEDNDPPDSAYRRDAGPFTTPDWRDSSLKYSQVSVWFEAGESKYINGNVHTNSSCAGTNITFPFAPGTHVEIKPVPRSFPEFGTPEWDAKVAEVAVEQAKDWPRHFSCDECRHEFYRPSRPGNIQRESCPQCRASVKFESEDEESRDSKIVPRNAETKVHEIHGGAVPCPCGHFKPVHDHKLPEPCVPGCPVFEAAKEMNAKAIKDIYNPDGFFTPQSFEFTGEQVEIKPQGPYGDGS